MSGAGRVRVEPCAKRVRVMLGGQIVADTTRAWLVWEKPYYPTYYFPFDDVRSELLSPAGESRRSPSRGEATAYNVTAGGKTAASAAHRHTDSAIPELADSIAFQWKAMDSWFEEDEEVFVHAKDPYKRVDILRSTRHVRVEIDGVTVADSHSPTLLFETSLPTRYYLPKTDVRMDLLQPTDQHTECPYKGWAQYWTVDVNDQSHPNVVWSYQFPTIESSKIAGLVSFYNEKVDIYLDGALMERPNSPF